MTFTDLTSQWPDLVKDGYTRESKPTLDYNCVAWAMSDNTKWWEPDPDGFLYWPNDRRSYALNSFIKIFRDDGYKRCNGGAFEPGFEKVAIYTEGTDFRHVARQRPDGKWWSKLGDYDDILHALHGVAGDKYGQPTVFLKRPIPTGSA